MRTKWFLILATVVGLTAAFTYLVVSNHYLREQVARWQTELAREESERQRLEYELAVAQEQARTARTPPRISAPAKPTNNAPALPAPVPPIPQGVGGSPDRDLPGVPGEGPASSVGSIVPVGGVPAWPEAGWARYVASPTGSVCLIEGQAAGDTGDSRAWKVQGRVIGGYLALDARFDFSQPASTVARFLGSNIAAQAEVVVPIRSLKSQAAVGAAVMDRKLQAVLNHEVHPNLHFRLTRLTLEPSPGDQGPPWLFASRGQLSVNGVTNDWEWHGFLEPLGPESLKLSVIETRRMTGFNISPPTQTIAGVRLQALDQVTVSLIWVLQREQPTTAGR